MARVQYHGCRSIDNTFPLRQDHEVFGRLQKVRAERSMRLSSVLGFSTLSSPGILLQLRIQKMRLALPNRESRFSSKPARSKAWL